MNEVSVLRKISYVTLLLLICVCSFLVAKYIVRDKLNGDTAPVDTSYKK